MLKPGMYTLSDCIAELRKVMVELDVIESELTDKDYALDMETQLDLEYAGKTPRILTLGEYEQSMMGYGSLKDEDANY